MKKTTLLSRFAVLVAIAAISGTAVAHHGPANEPLYDMSRIREFDGTVTDVFWRNPHARFRFRVVGGEEDGEIWEVETNPVGILLRTGFTRDLIPVGSEIKVAGVVSRRRPRQMELYNVLLPNGLEFADAARPKPLRYADQRLNLEQAQSNQAAVDAAASEADGIFRVWGRDRTSLGRFPDESMLTEAAKVAKAAFDPRTDLPHLDCIPPGMPTGMMIPSLFQFIDRGDTIELRVQEYDLLRTIHMDSGVDSDAQPATPLGYSVGRWEGDTLVVTTTRIDWPNSDRNGVPQSPDVIHVERFTPAPDGQTMAYELTSIDPVYLIGSPVRPGSFSWRPGSQIEPFECEVWEDDAQ